MKGAEKGRPNEKSELNENSNCSWAPLRRVLPCIPSTSENKTHRPDACLLWHIKLRDIISSRWVCPKVHQGA